MFVYSNVRQLGSGTLEIQGFGGNGTGTNNTGITMIGGLFEALGGPFTLRGGGGNDPTDTADDNHGVLNLGAAFLGLAPDTSGSSANDGEDVVGLP